MDYFFDRFDKGKLMAQGVIVKAENLEQALKKAKELFPEYENQVFEIRKKQEID